MYTLKSKVISVYLSTYFLTSKAFEHFQFQEYQSMVERIQSLLYSKGVSHLLQGSNTVIVSKSFVFDVGKNETGNRQIHNLQFREYSHM